ncbi:MULTISPECIES: DUF502 domain-containing protein [Spongiibacter]|uniref:DUF502 domain-containing protein n=1 Tax=Spongiibacter TaxID=630749 RepID=UPI000C627830|nr:MULTISPECIES: DUF502 domain-containing protein [Spongiibacter]MAY38757.1 hypothetical protein [Spongiibacter sp.]MBI57129.1 hypothetical protein [Spongiibacter sp.]|tara:strand:+ start:577 stop:1254 length:678 start_codon:yes stop_codon:yes gene_type:complete
MNKFKQFIGQSFLGGILVIAPIIILLLAMRWAVNAVQSLIAPLTGPLVKLSGAPPLLVDLLVIIVILFACFLVGTVVATSAGRFAQNFIDSHLSRFAPGYRLIRDIIQQVFGGDKNSPFTKGEVAVVQLYGVENPARVTAIITSRHDNGWFSVFVPTGPNPTSGFIYHLPPECVVPRPDIKLDVAFKSIIACGAGSAELGICREPLDTGSPRLSADREPQGEQGA